MDDGKTIQNIHTDILQYQRINAAWQLTCEVIKFNSIVGLTIIITIYPAATTN